MVLSRSSAWLYHSARTGAAVYPCLRPVRMGWAQETIGANGKRNGGTPDQGLSHLKSFRIRIFAKRKGGT